MDLGSDGTLTLANPIAANTGAGTAPNDIVASSDGQTIDVLESAVGVLAAYQVNGTSLTPVLRRPGLPLSIQGIAVQ